MANVSAVALIILTMMVRAKVISVLWGWFVVPLGMHSLSFSSAFGCLVLISVIRGVDWEDIKEHELPDYFRQIIMSFIHIAICFGIGALVNCAIQLH